MHAFWFDLLCSAALIDHLLVPIHTTMSFNRKVLNEYSKISDDIRAAAIRQRNPYPFWPYGDGIHFVERMDRFWTIMRPYPIREVWAGHHQKKSLAVISLVSTLWVGHYVRDTFNLVKRRLGMFHIYGPSVAGSVGGGHPITRSHSSNTIRSQTIFGVAVHTYFITDQIAANPLGHNRWALLIKSSLLQIATGCLYPLIFTTGSSMWFALKFHTYPVPDDIVKSRQSRRYILDRIVRPILTKNWRPLSVIILFNSLCCSALTWFEAKQIERIFRIELAKYSDDK